ncbi:MAG TPA: peroxiredoxin [Propionibacteriaceae bacterium]|nr:peroxiredoxin [Propionibacteriaceae bacterium]
MTVQLERGSAAPKFTLPTADGDEVSLDDLRGRKVILYFYPAAMSAGCTNEACDFRDNLGSLKGAGYEVLGISPDEPGKLVEFREREALTFPLLADRAGEVHAAYGAWGEKIVGGRTVTRPIRSTFVIDEDRRVELAMYNVQPIGHVKELRRSLGVDR